MGNNEGAGNYACQIGLLARIGGYAREGNGNRHEGEGIRVADDAVNYLYPCNKGQAYNLGRIDGGFSITAHTRGGVEMY